MATTSREETRHEYYTKIELDPLNNPKRLVFVAAPGAGSIPDNMRTLRRDYEETARTVAVLFADQSQERIAIFNVLHEAVDRGLRGKDYSIEDGEANLQVVRQDIVDNAIKVRDRYFNQYTRLLLLGAVLLVIGLVIHQTTGFGYLPLNTEDGSPNRVALWILSAFWIPAGATAGVWLEFALRMQKPPSYDQLLYMDPSRWNPRQRLMIATGVSFVLSFVLAFDVVQIGLGGVLLNDFAKKNAFLSLAVGGITGFAFPAVREIILRIRPEERGSGSARHVNP